MLIPAWHTLNYKPRLPPDYSPGIGIIGWGNIVKSAHLKAYNKHNLLYLRVTLATCRSADLDG